MKLKERIHRFLHDEKLKRKLYVIIFESDTPAGKLFDVILIGCILVSVLLVIIESLKGLPSFLTTPFVIMEYLFTAFFTFEYLTRIYCSPRPRKYIFSFFGIVDLLATLPLYIGLLFPGARYLLIIRAFRLIRVFRVFKLFNFLNEGERLLTALRESSKKIAVFFLFVVILVTSIGTLMYNTTQLPVQQHPEQHLLGYRHHDYRRLWRHHPRHRSWEVPFRLCHANRLHNYCRTDRDRICLHDERLQTQKRQRMSQLPSLRTRRQCRVLQILRT